MFKLPPSGDPYLTYLVTLLNAEFVRKEPTLVGWRHDATNLHIRFRAPIWVSWVQVHIQTTNAGEGQGTYDAANYASSTEVDCRADRLQDVSIVDQPYQRFYVWLIPVEYDASATKVLYDGQGGRPDYMSFVDIGV